MDLDLDLNPFTTTPTPLASSSPLVEKTSTTTTTTTHQTTTIRSPPLTCGPFTPELSEYYRRDSRDNRTFVVNDPDGLRNLLANRYQARFKRDYDQVRLLDEQLRQQQGVRVYDVPRIWMRVVAVGRGEGGPEPCGSHAPANQPSSTPSSSSSSLPPPPPDAFLRRQARKRLAEYRRWYGPTGHYYQQVGRLVPSDGSQGDRVQVTTTRRRRTTTTNLRLPEIHDLLSKRTRCRAEGRYQEADAIKFELWMHGVWVNDERGEWTTDPEQCSHWSTPPSSSFVASGNVTESEQEQERKQQFIPEKLYYQKEGQPVNGSLHRTQTIPKLYLRRMSNGPNRNKTEDELRWHQRVEQLVDLRGDARVRGEGSKAMFMALELYRTYGVVVNDDNLTWRVVGEGEPEYHLDKFLSWPVVEEDQRDRPLFPPILFAGADIPEMEFSYRRSSQSLPLEDERMVIRVAQLLWERAEKREDRKFLEGDGIRKELWYTYVSRFD